MLRGLILAAALTASSIALAAEPKSAADALAQKFSGAPDTATESKSAPAAKAPAKPAAAKGDAAKGGPAKSNGNGHRPLPPSFAAGARVQYFDGAAWLTGIIRSLEPAVLALDDESEIHTTRDVLAAGVAEGLVKLPS